MKVKKVLSTIVFLGMAFLLMNSLANKASPQNINLVSSSINGAFMILSIISQKNTDHFFGVEFKFTG
ncbi:MAG: hypothetical protein COV00_00010 [Candidatus Tagabacteria bacterium CG10_big_fil_rev_8_21_14_0_10_40_13]|uniref:Uncharacterized protein n=2 Tax=Parcubacteria group TaxID=1794811 RepID=A0A2M7UH00_9BACT|nr:MAG: hypothetical protein AUJ33_02185 [Parcubacteria group bacterium CG1_02_40_25]PIZ70490.1 MAG: hypothetical protein COY09_02905 [Candidatus Portnoybacteria bacterium CG_4_10_14_0_2_um_filter_39_11]PJE73396.1 MAG: hypothetical protein COV00_00010 [Candidatus Tagabacteria bacterium CG10_big_fil_rev_8_21_14_0_10_40_13]